LSVPVPFRTQVQKGCLPLLWINISKKLLMYLLVL
jgi:hypothetical protein